MLIFGHHISRQALLLSALDIILLMAVFVAASLLVPLGGQLATGSLPAVTLAAILAPSLLLLLSLTAFGAYKAEAWRSPRVAVERLMAGGLAGAAIILLAQMVLGETRPLGWVFGTVAVACAAVLGARTAAREFVSLRARLRPKAYVLGVGARAEAVWRACADNRNTRLQRFFHLEAAEADRIASAPVLPAARIQALPRTLIPLAHLDGVREVVVALDERRGTLPLDVLLECRMRGIRVLDSISFLERETGRVDLGVLNPSWLVFSGGFRYNSITIAAKRLLDLVGAAMLLLFLSPLILLVALAVKLDSPGPVFYSQERVGQYGRIFRILKFRSMVQDAEVAGEARWASQRDPRITRVGHVIRRYRLDEVPQLINVLKGEMSLVGPRPERPQFVALLARQISLYGERHQVKPGLTGWAQINYHYTDSLEDSRVKLEYDLYYVKNCNLFLDLVTLVQTVRIVFFGEGAR
jgi:sugar transferase (PEP-CTERM system associated)